METLASILARFHVNLYVLSAFKIGCKKRHLKSLRVNPLMDQSLFAAQVVSFIAKESTDAEAYRKASQAVKRQATGSAPTQSHSAPKKN